MEKHEFILELLKVVAPAIVSLGALFVSVYTLRLTKEWKKKELDEKEIDRQFQIKRLVSERAMTVLSDTLHQVHQINHGLNMYASASEIEKAAIWENVARIREYWEKNLLFLPTELRKEVMLLTFLSTASFAGQEVDKVAMSEAFRKVADVFGRIEGVYKKLDPYNLLNEPTSKP